MINDVKKAYFYAPATRRVFVVLPDEDRLPGEEGLCALLLKSLYGTRDAAYNWTEAYTKALIDLALPKRVVAVQLISQDEEHLHGRPR